MISTEESVAALSFGSQGFEPPGNPIVSSCHAARGHIARPGARIRDISYELFVWLNLGTGPNQDSSAEECESGVGPMALPPGNLLSQVKLPITETVHRRHNGGAEDAARWWQMQLAWVKEHKAELRP